MKPRQVLGKYLEVYGQGNPITPEAGKKGSFFEVKFCFIQRGEGIGPRQLGGSVLFVNFEKGLYSYLIS